MKKIIKYLAAGAAVIAVISGITISMSRPTYVETVTISPPASKRL